ncbi:MAG: hypothetical protein B7Z31_11990 [Rhodobacterales bacterium 12-65-15]|nr:MAG: hypothetical protein B7Z31_11990 [Rhodobacterales bacterium 12-65-15]
MTVQCRVGPNAFAVREALLAILGGPPVSDLPPDRRGVAELVLAEVLNNVAEHGYGGGAGDITVTLSRSCAGVSCLVVDQGRAMPDGCLPPGVLPGTDGVALADLPEGGFGWHLIRSLTTKLCYTREAEQNRLSFLI